MEAVHHNVSDHRFELTIDGRQGFAEYLLEGDVMTLTHTWVPPELRGKGVAGRLVGAAMEFARREKMQVVPQCSYVETFLRRHPEFADLRAL